MKLRLQVLPVAGLAALFLTGCQTQQNSNPFPAPQTKTVQKPTVQTTTTKTTAAKPKIDPINDPALRDSGSSGGGGGGGGGSPGGGGGGSWN